MSKRELVETYRDAIVELAAKHGAGHVRLAGSVARGEAGRDLDLLVAMEKGRSLLDRARLVTDLEDLLACEVDVINERGAKPAVLETLRRDAVPL